MAIIDQISIEQWNAFFKAPSAASTFVSTASGGGFDIQKEALSASNFMQDIISQESGSMYGELVDQLLATMKSIKRKNVKEYALKIKSRKPDAM